MLPLHADGAPLQYKFVIYAWNIFFLKNPTKILNFTEESKQHLSYEL